jgi:hypothetical protein
MGETGISGESGSDLRKGEDVLIASGPKAGEGGHDASDSLLAFRRIPPRGILSGEVKAGLGGMRRELCNVGETPSEVMCYGGGVVASVRESYGAD